MRTLLPLLALCLATAALAGCTSAPETPTPTPGPTSSPTPMTPTPSASPTPTVVPTLPTPTPTVPTSNATSIEMTYAQPRGPANGDALVCWRIDGNGRAAHVAVHYDSASHNGTDVTFASYVGGARYPNNQTSLSVDGYALPGLFCTIVPIPATGKVYYRAHVMDATGPPGLLSEEASTGITGTATGVTITSSPTTLERGAKGEVCWRVEGSGNVAHTAVHFDDATHPDGNVTFAAYDEGAVYPGSTPSLAEEGYDLPGDFCADLIMPSSGDLYYRAHVIDGAGAPGQLSAEATTPAT